MKSPFVETASGVNEMVAILRNVEMFGIDTEFIRETTFFPKIALIQVATDSQTWLLDPLKLTADDLAPFLELLVDPKILKIMHAAFADQEVLYWTYGVTAAPILDTAVAAALCGYGDNVGLGKVVKDVLRIHLHKGRARVKWLARPLPEELLSYARADVEHLVELALRMQEVLQKRNRWHWALEESAADVEAFDTPPDAIAHRLSKSGQLDETTYLALRELVRWREDRARSADLPRAWVAENEVLMSLARARPRTIAELRSFRGINAKEIDRNGETILGAIARGVGTPKNEADLPVRNASTADVDSLALDLMKAYLSCLSARYEIAPRFLIRTGRVADLLVSSTQSPEKWVAQGILSRSAAEVIGRDLQDLLLGRVVLGIASGRVQIVSR
jgi:ribonuclease D